MEKIKNANDWNILRETLYPWAGPMPVMEIGGPPYEMGKAHGELCKPMVSFIIETFIDQLVKGTTVSKQRLDEEAKLYEKTLLKHDLTRPYVEEMKGLADGAEADYKDVLILNCGWDLLTSLPTPEEHPDYMCSLASAWDGSTGDGFLHCGHNDDGGRFIDQFLVLMHARPADGHAFAAPVVPGYIGYHRMWNNRGAIILGTALEDGCKNDEFHYGIPMWIVHRIVAEHASSTEEALSLINDYPMATSFNLFLADRSHDVKIVQATGKHTIVLDYNETTTAALTNHALTDEIKPYLVMREHPSSTDYRIQTVSRLIEEKAPKINRRSIQEILSSHFDAGAGRDYPSMDCPCRHGEYEGKMSGTVSCVTLSVTSKQVIAEVSLGNPCRNNWRKLEMDLG